MELQEQMMSNGAKLSLLLLSMTVLFMAALTSGAIQSKHWKIQNIELLAEFKRVNSEQIRIAVAAYPERSFFKVKASDIREKIQQIPWVQQVSVNKKWPQSLMITILEHKAVAVWNRNKLLNENGEIFEVDSIDDLTTLPKVEGNNKNSKKIWDKFIRFNDIVKNTGLDINSATVSARGSWILGLSNGMTINLGSQQMDARLVRLADTWNTLSKQKDQMPYYLDLRYTNGYVAKWPVAQLDEIKQIKDNGSKNG